MNSVRERHQSYRLDREALDMTEYQTLANGTAIFPRVYTESQVREIVEWLSPELGVKISHDQVEERVTYALERYETPFSRLVYPVLGLVGEAGEIANKLKKVARDGGGDMSTERAEQIAEELGDVQWYVAAVATGLKAKLAEIGNQNIDKLYSRKSRGVISGDGDRR